MIDNYRVNAQREIVPITDIEGDARRQWRRRARGRRAVINTSAHGPAEVLGHKVMKFT